MKIRCRACNELVEPSEGWSGWPFVCPKCRAARAASGPAPEAASSEAAFLAYADSHSRWPKRLVIVGGAIAVLVAGILVWGWWSERQVRKSNAAFFARAVPVRYHRSGGPQPAGELDLSKVKVPTDIVEALRNGRCLGRPDYDWLATAEWLLLSDGREQRRVQICQKRQCHFVVNGIAYACPYLDRALGELRDRLRAEGGGKPGPDAPRKSEEPPK